MKAFKIIGIILLIMSVILISYAFMYHVWVESGSSDSLSLKLFGTTILMGVWGAAFFAIYNNHK